MRRRLAAGIVALVWIAGCAALGGRGPAPASEEERKAFAEAVSALPEDPAAAEERLELFLRTWPESSLADDAGLRLAEIALAEGRREDALRRFYTVVRRYPDGDRADAARVQIASLEYERGNPEMAAHVLGRTRLSRLSRAERRVAYRVLAGAAPDPVAKLRWLARLRTEQTDEEELAQIDRQIDEIIFDLDEPDLRRAADQIGRQVPAARVMLRLAELSLDAGDLEGARATLDRASRLPLAPPYAARLSAVGDRLRFREEGTDDAAELPTLADVRHLALPSTAGASGTLGVVLPLSGPFAHFGEESLYGVLLAARVFGAQAEHYAGPGVRVLVRDSAGRPERAAQAVRELAGYEDLSAIVGPLLSGECEAAAGAAEAEGVPLLALTSREEIARERPHVFRLRTVPREETQVLVDHAMREFGAQSFAILYPRDAYGRGLRSLFWDAVEERGGDIVGVAAYDPGATDFAEPIRRLVGYVLLTPGEKAAIKKREEMLDRARRLEPKEGAELRAEARAMTGAEGEPLPPIVDFDALFIPESHEKVVLIAPQLAFHEAVGTRLLGPSGWYHPDLVAIGGKHVEGALFTAQFFPDSPLPFVHRFAESYRASFAAEPDALAAQSFDAANLVLVQLARGLRSREAVRDGVLATRVFPGVTGVLSMRADGNARKRPFLLGVERGRVIQIDQ